MGALTMQNPLAHSSPWVLCVLLLPWLVVEIGLLLRRPTPVRLAMLTLLGSSGLTLLASPHALPLVLVAARTGGVTALFALSILLPALLVCCLLEASGVFALWAQGLCWLCPQRELLVLAVVLGLSPFAEALCGFGSGILLSLPLLLSLDLTQEQAGLLALLGQSSTAFSGLANALTVQAALTGSQADPLGMVTAALLLPIHLLCAAFALLLSGGILALRRHVASAMLASVVLAAGEGIGSWLLGVEVAGLLSSASVLLLFIVARITVQASQQGACRGGGASRSALHCIGALLPVVVLCAAVLLCHLIGPLHAWLALHATWWIGKEAFPLAGPSGFLLLSALTAGALLLVRHEQAALRAAFCAPGEQACPPALPCAPFCSVGHCSRPPG